MIPHETKHAEQEYKLHKFLCHDVIPSDDLGKALLIWKIIEWVDDCIDEDIDLDDVDYYSQIDELDANLYSLAEMSNLMEKYEIYNNLDFNLYMRGLVSIILASLEYNREGVESPQIAKAMSRFDNKIQSAKAGDFGASAKNAVERITAGGFDLKNAFGSVTKKLDELAMQLILENEYFKKMGAKKLNLAKGGKLVFGDNHTGLEGYDEVVDGFGVEADSEYARFVEKYIATGDAVYQDFIKELCLEM